MAKQLSGFQKRKQKREREDSERKALLGIPEDGDTGAEAFAELGPPDIDSPETALEFTRKYLLTSLYQIGNDRSLPARDRWRLIKDTAQAIGMTHPRATIEAGFKKLRERRGATEPAEVKAKPDGIARPATARSYRADRGREPLPGPVPASEAGLDEGNAPVGGGRVGPAGPKVH